MKKLFSIMLAVILALSIIPTAFASSDYDRKAVASNDKQTIDDLSEEQIIGVILDWVDREVASLAENFDQFNEQLSLVGMSVPTNLDGIIAYKDFVNELGGDFANLDTSALTTRADAGSDLQFVYNVISFVAMNSDTFGKVFAWEEGQTFDFGKIGEYITNPENEVDQSIVDFYNNYLIGGNIQEKFVNEIAREMNYEIKDGESFDEVIDNGIKNVVADFLSKAGLISDELKATIVAEDDKEYDLKTTDIYTLVKKLFADIQSDNEATINTYFTYLCDNVVRPILKTAFGCLVEQTTNAAPASVLAEFKKAYDEKVLSEITSGDVLFRSNDGKYWSISGYGKSGVEVKYAESLLNFEPPTVEIGDKNTVIGTYTPTNPDPASYQPTVYTSADYSQYIDQDLLATADEFGVTVTSDALPENITDIISAGNGVAMQDEFKMTINGKVLGNDLNQTIELTFEEIEALANSAIAAQIPQIQATVDPIVASAVNAANQMPFIGGSITGGITINAITVALSYVGYSNEDTFVCEVTVVPSYDISYTGNVWNYASMVGLTKDKIEADYIQPAIDNAITNPVATIVVENLNGSIDGMEDVTALMNYVNSDFAVDTSILDFAANYDEYKGFVGQMNRLLCDVVKMVLSEEGYASLDLTEGGNENLTANIEKICKKTDGILSAAKQFMDANEFEEFANSVNIDSIFASEHGFNAAMLYDLDFSNVENLYVCAIRMGCDLLVKDNEGVLYDIHMIVEDLDTLEQIAVGLFNYAMPTLVEKANEELGEFGIELAFVADKEAKDIASNEAAKDYIMGKAIDLVYDLAVQAVPVANQLVNDFISKEAEEMGIENVPTIAFELKVEKGNTWQATLTNLVNRFYELTDGVLLILAADNANVYDKISAVLTDFLPLGSMLSNAGKNGKNGSIDVAYILDVLFNQCLDGNFDNFLRMFEVKEDKIAGDVTVTKALINASQHMTDAVFPGTVVASDYMDYEPETSVQQYFTSSENDVVIASNNMKSLDNVKTTLIPSLLNGVVRESGVLPFFAACNNHTFGDEVVTKSTCTVAGTSVKTCTTCGYTVTENLALDPTNHANIVNVDKVEATCETDGHTAGTKCAACNTPIVAVEVIKATGHKAITIEAQKATCTKDGSTEGSKCSVCQKVLVAPQVEKATGHSYGKWVVTKEATCVSTGTKTATCSKCNEVKTETIAATGNHIDADGDDICDTCGKELKEKQSETVWQKIVNFFNSIIDWFRRLFG